MYHFLQLFHSIPHFELQSKKEADNDFYNSVAIENKINMTNFATRWNEYVDEENRASFKNNLIATITYLVSTIMSLIALFLPGPYNIREIVKQTKNNDSIN